MRLVLSALLALALGLLPVTNARADIVPDVAPPMSCHEMMGGAGQADSGDEAPAHGMQACADHCMSQVNGQPAVAPVAAPSLLNAISAAALSGADLGTPHLRAPPDPPPPRI